MTSSHYRVQVGFELTSVLTLPIKYWFQDVPPFHSPSGILKEQNDEIILQFNKTSPA